MHLGVIPDGNRRFARNHNLKEKQAYRTAKNVIIDAFDEIDTLPVEINEVTFYLLSEDNLERDEADLEALFELLEEELEEAAKSFNVDGFSFNWVSTRPNGIPEYLQDKLKQLEERFNDGEKQMNALISYSGKKDILQASKKIKEKGEKFTENKLEENLNLGNEIDFVIRTGDNPTRECLSDFPIWNASYSEYYHIKKHFPAVESDDIREALNHYKKLRRKKGK